MQVINLARKYLLSPAIAHYAACSQSAAPLVRVLLLPLVVVVHLLEIACYLLTWSAPPLPRPHPRPALQLSHIHISRPA